jgi:hypothetical protein
MQMPEIALAQPTFLSLLEGEFGPCEGMVLGYNDEDKSAQEGWRWCASVLPANNMSHYLNRRRKDGKKDPFLIILGSTLDALKRSGVPRAFYGVGLLANMNQEASKLLHLDQLQDPQNRNVNGDFKWPIGAPLLRVWQPPVPIPFSDLLGRPVSFNQGHGAHVVNIEDKAIQGIRQALGSIGLREAGMRRPQPIPPAILKLLREVHAPELKDQTRDQPAFVSVIPAESDSPVETRPKPETQNQASDDSTATVIGPDLVPIAEQALQSIARLPPEQHERAFQELEAARIKGDMEVAAGLGGRCDILTDAEVVEVKRYSAWRHALGQILSYGFFFPGRSLRVHLFDPPPSPEYDVLTICEKYGVNVSFAGHSLQEV